MWSACRAPLAVRGAALALVVFGVSTLGASSVLLAGPPVAGAAGAASSRTPGRALLTLTDQTQWVVPASSGDGAFDLELAARDAPVGAKVGVVLYPRLDTRFAFKSDVASGPRGYPLSTAEPTGWSRLPAAPSRSGSRVDALTVVPTTSIGASGRLGLACAPPTGTGTCTGVYPMSVELLGASGKVLSRFTTFLTYVAGKSAHPLEVAWVVPISAPISFGPHASDDPAQAVAPLSASEAGALSTLVSQLRGAASVPVTLDASPETLQRLASSGPAGTKATTLLAQGSADQAHEEVLAAPYVPIDLGALAGAGEPTEIVAQMDAGSTVLRHLHVATTSSPIWVASGAVGTDLAGGLALVGASRVVVPEGDLSGTLTYPGTWAFTFHLLPKSTSRGKSKGAPAVDAADTDTELDSHFTAHPGDPALAATQLLADLAIVHFERPNTRAVRGMVAVPPSGWVPDAAFDRVLLAGLTGNPVVQPVTMSQYFATVTRSGSRSLATSAKGPVLEASLARAYSAGRVKLTEFDSAVAAHPPIEAELDELLLTSESSVLGPSKKRAGVVEFERALSAQLSLVRFSTEHTFTLTARSGWIPVTVVSHASYTVVGTLSVSGSELTFPHRSSRRMNLDHATNPWRVDVVVRSSGDFPLRVVFTSPDGKLVFAHGQVTVRSTATSTVGIGLSVAALVILLTWWARTWLGGRRRRALRAGTPRHPAAPAGSRLPA